MDVTNLFRFFCWDKLKFDLTTPRKVAADCDQVTQSNVGMNYAKRNDWWECFLSIDVAFEACKFQQLYFI